jgi:hypothetical protein
LASSLPCACATSPLSSMIKIDTANNTGFKAALILRRDDGTISFLKGGLVGIRRFNFALTKAFHEMHLLPRSRSG